MKKFITLFVLLAFTFSMIPPCYAIDENAPDSFTENSRKASDETLELAGSAVQTLAEHLVFSISLGISLEQMYDTARWVAPETTILETKNDASLALIELYEELLDELCESDIDSYHAYVKITYENEVENAGGENPVETDTIRRVREIYLMRETIEAMLALDCYYDLLDESEVRRMTEDFDEFANLDYASTKKIYDDAAPLTRFERFRANSILELVGDCEESSVPLSLSSVTSTVPANGFDYTYGSTVNTTSGNPVTI